MSRQNLNSKKIVELLEEAGDLLNQAKAMMKTDGFVFNKNGFDDRKQDLENTGSIIEGVFNGEFLIDKNNKKYPVPANYASKSKLVEGDILKLTILDNGSFIFKQIGPIERVKKIAKIKKVKNEVVADCEGTFYKVLPAALSYYQAKVGDEATVILPKGRKSIFAAIENVIPK